MNTHGSIASFNTSMAMFPSLHRRETAGHCTNYVKCKLCKGEMLFDSCSQVCGREQCRTILSHLALQRYDFREEFWRRFDALPRNATKGGLGLWDLEQMMSDAEGEVAA
jgi:hypothetical protein